MDTLIIATRGSALALWQAEHVKAALRAREPGLTVELQIIKTTGDKILDVPLSKVGGKALFVKEIEQALIDRTADLAVHSMKDVPAELAPGLELAAISAREVPWDALCTRDGTDLDGLPPGARVGTSSLRRQCQLLARRPDLQILMLRGNVPTRLARLDAGDYDAVVLAAAGLTRLGFADRISQALPADVCLPAVAQGVLGLETRAGDTPVIERIRAAMHDAREAPRIVAERAFLARMGGSCQTPLAAHATYAGDRLVIDALCGTPDGTRVLRSQASGSPDDADALGVDAADRLL
ncbi:MAG: hydroxymethylbilane synthase, partial [Myxococcales bacterium]|nr:hydroxymethylbilane synthase [Myxococcales bacterium]